MRKKRKLLRMRKKKKLLRKHSLRILKVKHLQHLVRKSVKISKRVNLMTLTNCWRPFYQHLSKKKASRSSLMKDLILTKSLERSMEIRNKPSSKNAKLLLLNCLKKKNNRLTQ